MHYTFTVKSISTELQQLNGNTKPDIHPQPQQKILELLLSFRLNCMHVWHNYS